MFRGSSTPTCSCERRFRRSSMRTADLSFEMTRAATGGRACWLTWATGRGWSHEEALSRDRRSHAEHGRAGRDAGGGTDLGRGALAQETAMASPERERVHALGDSQGSGRALRRLAGIPAWTPSTTNPTPSKRSARCCAKANRPRHDRAGASAPGERSAPSVQKFANISADEHPHIAALVAGARQQLREIAARRKDVRPTDVQQLEDTCFFIVDHCIQMDLKDPFLVLERLGKRQWHAVVDQHVETIGVGDGATALSAMQMLHTRVKSYRQRLARGLTEWAPTELEHVPAPELPRARRRRGWLDRLLRWRPGSLHRVRHGLSRQRDRTRRFSAPIPPQEGTWLMNDPTRRQWTLFKLAQWCLLGGVVSLGLFLPVMLRPSSRCLLLASLRMPCAGRPMFPQDKHEHPIASQAPGVVPPVPGGDGSTQADADDPLRQASRGGEASLGGRDRASTCGGCSRCQGGPGCSGLPATSALPPASARCPTCGHGLEPVTAGSTTSATSAASPAAEPLEHTRARP